MSLVEDSPKVIEDLSYQAITVHKDELSVDTYGVVQSPWERQMNKMLTE